MQETNTEKLKGAYRIYSNKLRGTYEIFRASSAVLNRGQRLFEIGAYLKIGCFKNFFLFNCCIACIYTKKLQLVTEASFIVAIHHFSVVSSLNSDLTFPFYNNPFLKKGHSQCGFRFSLLWLLSYTEFFE